MQKNVGGYDRLARLVAGPLLIVVGIAGYAGLVALAFGPFPQALTSIVVLLVGLVLAITGAVQKCPLNSLFSVNTYRRRGEAEAETETAGARRCGPGSRAESGGADRPSTPASSTTTFVFRGPHALRNCPAHPST